MDSKNMIKREAHFGGKFRAWLRAHPRSSGAFELKQTRTNSIPFSAVMEHQIDALMAVKNGGLLYKAPDDSAGVKPFDFFYLRNEPAYIVIKFPRCFVGIDVETWVREQERSMRKSLTVSRAKEICVFSSQLSTGGSCADE